MKNRLLSTCFLLSSLSVPGCGSSARTSISRPHFTNQRVLHELSQEIRQTCEISNTEISYQIPNQEPLQINPLDRRLAIKDEASITIPIHEINNCVRNILRSIEIKGLNVQQDKIEFKLGQNSELNTDLLSIFARLERQNLADKLECTTADFSSYFVKGIVCNLFELNPLQKSQISHAFLALGYHPNLNDQQLIATKK